MILCYTPSNIDSKEIERRVKLLTDRLMIFFIEEDDIEIINESNQKVLRDMITLYKPIMFYVDSLKEMDMSQTQICELILFIIKHNCVFQSEKDSLFFESKDIDKVYLMVYDTFKNKIQKIV